MATTIITKNMRVAQGLVEPENEEIYTNATITINTDIEYPDNILLTLLWITEQKATFNPDKQDPLSLSHFQQALDKYGAENYQKIVEEFWGLYRLEFTSQRALLKKMLAPAMPILNLPPKAQCPRCLQNIWDTTDPLSIVDNPHPVYCLNCGQLFKYEDTAVISIKTSMNLRQLASKLEQNDNTILESMEALF